MKKIFLMLAILGIFLPAVRQAEAVDVSIDFFYDNLHDGNWVEVADYGYCWQPGVAVSNADWRPYADGYWAYTDVGWTWVSYEDFGWATYHYGRWIRLEDQGWVWVPGYEWGPAWVSWRTGGDYVGWAPLPPAREYVYEGRPITGRVDVEFDIGPLYYNFVEIRYIGEPVLRRHICRPSDNITVINKTVNVTNITYNNSVVYNYGPDYDRLSQYSSRPIQRLRIEREARADFKGDVRTKNVTKVQGDKLVVAAPATLTKPAKPVAPKNVKTKIAQPKLERGWSGVTDPKAKAELQAKMKSEDAKQVPPPTTQPVQKAAGAAAPGASFGAQATTASPAPATARTTPPPPAPEKARREASQPPPTPIEKPARNFTPQPKGEDALSRDRDRDRRGRRDQEPGPTPKPGKPGALEQDQTGAPPERPRRRPPEPNGPQRDEAAPSPRRQADEPMKEAGKRQRGPELAPTGQAPNLEGPRGRRVPPGDRAEGQRRPERAPSGEGEKRGKKEGGERKKGAEPSPTP